MSEQQPCPRCGGGLRTQQRDSVLTKYCDRCGPMPIGKNIKTGETVWVQR